MLPFNGTEVIRVSDFGIFLSGIYFCLIVSSDIKESVDNVFSVR